MKLLFSPPYLEDGLRRAVLGGGWADLEVVSSLEGCAPGDYARVALVAGSPASAWTWAHSQGLTEKGAALQVASRLLANAANVDGLLGALRVEEAELRVNPVSTLSQIVAFLCEDQALSWQPPDDIGDSFSSASGETPDAAELGALEFYGRLPLAPGIAAWWPPDIFHFAEPSPAGAIDICGPARNLMFGPYVCLSPGLWQAELRFEVCEDAARYDYIVDFNLPGNATECVVRPIGPGRQVATLRHRVSATAPAEIRLWLGRAAFHGHLRVVGAKLTLLERSVPMTFGPMADLSEQESSR